MAGENGESGHLQVGLSKQEEKHLMWDSKLVKSASVLKSE